MFKKICVVGLGYVGIPVAVKFAKGGLFVVGIDILRNKVDEINNGNYPLDSTEPGLPEMLREVVDKRLFRAVTEYGECKDADAILVSVETPFSKEDNVPNYKALESAATSIGKNMKKGTLISIESTIAPMTMGTLLQPILEKESGMKAGEDFYLIHCPERVMPGKLLYNLEKLDRVIGGLDDKSAELGKELYKRVCEGTLHTTDMLTAEVVKTTENTYRDVEIAFANELALLCENIGVDVYEVRDLVNKSPGRNMLVPGAGVGGHCITKDSLLLVHGSSGRFEPKMIKLARQINDYMPVHMIELVQDALKEKGMSVASSVITILGVSYLPNVGDYRNSPALPIIEGLRRDGATLKICDPHIEKLDKKGLLSIDDSIAESDAIVLITAHNEFMELAGEKNLKKLKDSVNTPIIIDGRNMFDGDLCKRLGFTYRGVGK